MEAKEQLQLLQKKHDTLQEKHDTLQKKYDDDMKVMEQQLFRIVKFIGSDHDFSSILYFKVYSFDMQVFASTYNEVRPLDFKCSHGSLQLIIVYMYMLLF